MEPGDADVEESMPVHPSTAKLKEAEKYFSTGNLGMKGMSNNGMGMFKG